MKEKENPYSGILGTLREDASARSIPAWRLGVVMSVAPLAIACGGIILTGRDLLINAQLLENLERVELSDISGELNGSCDCENGCGATTLRMAGGTLAATGVFGGVLAVGCRVAMLAQEDSDLFVVLCKVVDG